MGVFKAPKPREIMGISFIPISSFMAIQWARNYQMNPNILQSQEGNQACFDNLSKDQKVGLIVYNSFRALDSMKPEPDLYNPQHIDLIESMYPLIDKICDLNIIIAVMPTCIYQGRTHNLELVKLKTSIVISSLMDLIPLGLQDINSTVNWLRTELEMGRQIIVYQFIRTMTLISVENLNNQLKGVMIRYKRFI
jgi:hypothetical protein